MGLEKHLEPAVAGRVDELLVEHRSANQDDYRKLQDIQKEMDKETCTVLEKYMEVWNVWSSDELFHVYEKAFADGVRMMLHILTVK